MTQELIDYCKKEFTNATGQKYPCSNQIVGCFVLCQEIDDKIYSFLEEKNMRIYQKDSYSMKAKSNDTSWTIIKLNSSCRGYRYYKVYIDKRINDYDFETLISPKMCNYCKEVDFF